MNARNLMVSIFIIGIFINFGLFLYVIGRIDRSKLKGAKGEDGPRGPRGDKGPIGDIGPGSTLKGPTGFKGAVGRKGNPLFELIHADSTPKKCKVNTFCRVQGQVCEVNSNSFRKCCNNKWIDISSDSDSCPDEERRTPEPCN